MSYRVSGSGFQLSGLDGSTPCVLLPAGILASLPKGFTSASQSGATFTFYTGPVAPPGAWRQQLGTASPEVDTLAAAFVGATVLLQTGLGAGWTVGTVVADGTTQFVAGIATPLLSSLRALVFSGGGYVAPTTGQPDGGSYSIASRSADGAHIWWGPVGGAASFYTPSTMTTLGAVAPGTLALVETQPTSPQSDGGQWRVLTV